jgi:hypothetical protein
MEMFGNYLNPSRQHRIPLGFKADVHHEVITHNPSSATPGENLCVRIPKLEANRLLVPGTLQLTFDLNCSGKAANSLVGNVAHNLR